MTNHQQARDAAARLAYPDEGGHNWQHTGGWGRQIKAQRLAGYNRRKPMNLAKWRKWDLDTSRHVIEQTTPTGTCQNCDKQYTVSRPSLADTQKYCSTTCQTAAAKQRWKERHQ
jgi:hypothetical protein